MSNKTVHKLEELQEVLAQDHTGHNETENFQSSKQCVLPTWQPPEF